MTVAFPTGIVQGGSIGMGSFCDTFESEVTTTTSALTTMQDISTTNDTIGVIDILVTGHRTGGVTSYYHKFFNCFYRTYGGVIHLYNHETPLYSYNNVSDLWNATISTPSGTTFRLSVQGLGITILWRAFFWHFHD